MIKRNIIPQITENMIHARAKEIAENESYNYVISEVRKKELEMYEKWCREIKKGIEKNETV